MSGPLRREDYPPNWEALVAEVRVRSGHGCEGSPAYPDCRIPHGAPSLISGKPVVLTTAHLCQDSTCADLAHLRAWCQRCHLTYDAAQHRATAARTRRAQLEAAGQLVLFSPPAHGRWLAASGVAGPVSAAWRPGGRGRPAAVNCPPRPRACGSRSGACPPRRLAGGSGGSAWGRPGGVAHSGPGTPRPAAAG